MHQGLWLLCVMYLSQTNIKVSLRLSNWYSASNTFMLMCRRAANSLQTFRACSSAEAFSMITRLSSSDATQMTEKRGRLLKGYV